MMNDFLIMLIIFALLFIVAFFSMIHVNSNKHNTLSIVVYMLVGILAIRLSMSIDVLPYTMMILYSIPLTFLKIRNDGDK